MYGHLPQMASTKDIWLQLSVFLQGWFVALKAYGYQVFFSKTNLNHLFSWFHGLCIIAPKSLKSFHTLTKDMKDMLGEMGKSLKYFSGRQLLSRQTSLDDVEINWLFRIVH